MAKPKSPIELFETGENFYSQHYFGVHQVQQGEQTGFIFRVWAPNAQALWLVGDFNEWNRSLPLRKDAHFGVWEIFTPLPKVGDFYKFLVKQADGREVYKIDPFATTFEKRPNNAAVIQTVPERKWRDKAWQNSAKQSGQLDQP